MHPAPPASVPKMDKLRQPLAQAPPPSAFNAAQGIWPPRDTHSRYRYHLKLSGASEAPRLALRIVMRNKR
eukprot:610291-Pyramimonas_sp.AAC.1